MGFIAKWDNDNRSSCVSIVRGEWTWAEFVDHLLCVYEMIESSDNTVDVIAPGTDEIEYPEEDLADDLRRLRDACPPNLGLLVLVCETRSPRAMRDVMSRIYTADRVAYVNSLDAARALLAAKHAS